MMRLDADPSCVMANSNAASHQPDMNQVNEPNEPFDEFAFPVDSIVRVDQLQPAQDTFMLSEQEVEEANQRVRMLQLPQTNQWQPKQ